MKPPRETEAEEDALEQVARYLDGAGLRGGWLALFDLGQGSTRAEKLTLIALEWAAIRWWKSAAERPQPGVTQERELAPVDWPSSRH